jgi:hypothetical protein
MDKKNNLKEAWKKGQSGNPKGRPPKLIASTIKDLKEAGYQPATAAQIKEASEVLITLDKDKLVEIGKDEMQPMYLRIVARELLGKKGLDVMNTILDRAHGKAKQSVEHSGGIDTNFTVSPVDTDAIKAIFEKVNGNQNNQSK